MSGCAGGLRGFHVLIGAAGWGRGRWTGLAVDDDGLVLAPAQSHVLTATLEGRDLPPEIEDTDLAIGRCGLLHLLLSSAGGARALLTYDPLQARSEPAACLDPEILARPSAIAFFTPPSGRGPGGLGTLYLANLEGERRIVALAELGGQIRWTVGPERGAAGRPLGLDGPLYPLDLAVDARGFLHVLVPFGEAQQRRVVLAILVLDPGGRRVAVLHPESAGPERPGRRGTPQGGGRSSRDFSVGPPDNGDTGGGAGPGGGLPRGLYLAVAPEGDLWVLDGPGRRLLHLSPQGTFLGEVDFTSFSDLPEEIAPRGLAIDRDGNLYLGDGRARDTGNGTAQPEEDTRFVHRFAPDPGSAAGLRYLGPVAGYRGQVRALAVDGNGRIFLFNREERRIVLLSPRTSLGGRDSAPTGTYLSPPLDSRRAGTRWHRVRLELDLPERTQVRLSWATLEEAGPYRDFLAGEDTEIAWSEPAVNPTDALVRAGPGRYLALRLELTGTAEASPRVRSLRADFPRTSLASLLPAVYQREAAPDTFLERFLALFGTYFDDAEARIDTLIRLFDPRAEDRVRGPFLTWLASWLALAAEASWPEETVRELLKRAPELYRLRGTRAGIEMLVEIFTGARPLVVEKFQLRCAEGSELADDLERLYGDDPYAFCVLLPPRSVAGEDARRALRRAIEADTPAHTRAGVRLLAERIVLGHHSYLEINSALPAPSPRLDSGAALPLDSLLIDLDEAGQIGRRSRTGLDTTLT